MQSFIQVAELVALDDEEAWLENLLIRLNQRQQGFQLTRAWNVDKNDFKRPEGHDLLNVKRIRLNQFTIPDIRTSFELCPTGRKLLRAFVYPYKGKTSKQLVSKVGKACISLCLPTTYCANREIIIVVVALWQPTSKHLSDFRTTFSTAALYSSTCSVTMIGTSLVKLLICLLLYCGFTERLFFTAQPLRAEEVVK